MSSELLHRTREYAIAVVRLWQCLPMRTDAAVLGKQLLRCATSVGANYRSALHAKSKADFWSKMKICEEEADESEYWLELIEACEIVSPQQLASIRAEAHELASIMATAARKAREALDRAPAPKRTTRHPSP